MDVLEIFDGCSGDILWVSWRYLISVPKNIFGRCSWNGCPGDI